MGQIQNAMSGLANTLEGSVKSLLLAKLDKSSTGTETTPKMAAKPVASNIQPIGNTPTSSFASSMPASSSTPLNYSMDYQRNAPKAYDSEKAEQAKQRVQVQLMSIKNLRELMGVK